jgi:hypothetical protein
MKNPKNEKNINNKVWNLFGLFSIERKTNVLAFAAFLIAIVSATYQLTNYLKGPDVILFSPDQIMLEKRESTEDEMLLGIVAPMSYVNTGGAGYNGTVHREIIRFQLGAKIFEYTWQEFGRSTSEGRELIFNTMGEARPFPVNGGSSDSHETRFAPRRPRCPTHDRDCLNSNFLSTETFFDKTNGLKKLRFEFIADVFSEDRICAACEIDIDPSLWASLAINQWVTFPCWKASCSGN